MPVYIKVPEIGGQSHGCYGCIAFEEGDESVTCQKLAAHAGSKGCVHPGIIWIEDTEAARLAYITLKLEN